MRQESVNGIEYQFAKINAVEQFHVVRRLAPIIGDLLAALTSKIPAGQSMQSLKDSFTEADGAELMVPVANAIAKLSDEDANYVLFKLLQSIQRKQQGGGWAHIKVSGKDILMFDDIDMPTMLKLAGLSLMENLGGFIAALPTGLKEGAVRP